MSNNLNIGGSKEKTDKKIRARACDQCRRRKVRCNGGDIPIGSRCANCVAFEYECTYIAPTSSKPQIDANYVKGLETQIAELKRQLESMNVEPSKPPARYSQAIDYASSDGPPTTGPSSSSTPAAPVVGSDIQNLPQDDTETKEELIELLHSMSLSVKHTHFIGRSSSLVFVRAAVALKREFTSLGFDPDFDHSRRDKFTARQPEFWEDLPKLIRAETSYPPTAFPNPSLMGKLVQEYFVRMNDIYPLLHRPTFEYGISIGLHLKDEGFGSTVLLVCALGSRFVDDEGVLPQGIKSWHWAGWHWFQHVNSSRRFVHTFAPRVYDLQICFLFAMFVANSPVPHAIYSVIGHGLRLATDMGAHRRIAYGARPTIEDELKKRALWCLVVNDRSMCDKLGRPYNIDDEDLEVGLPVECDDEYWIVDGQDVAFAHPPGTPSKIAAFNCMIRLSRIHAEGFRAVYYTDPVKLHSDPERARRVVSELDSKLNAFIDSIPGYLRWSPHRNNSVFTNQSAFIYSCYYFIQIMIHRAFVPLPDRPAPLPFPSLAICTNAARSALHIMDVQFTNLRDFTFPQAHWHPITIFTCATVLLINVWNARRMGLAADTAKDLKDVQRADFILSHFEKRWIGATRLGYILHDVIEVVAATRSAVDEQRKRKRVAHDNAPGTSTLHTVHPLEPDAQRLRHSPEPAFPRVFPSQAEITGYPDGQFVLPVHSDELGRLPIWPHLEPSDAAPSAGSFGGTLWPSLGEETFVDFGPELESVFADLFPEVAFGDVAGSFGEESSAGFQDGHGGAGVVGGQMQRGLYMVPCGTGNGAGVDSFATDNYPGPPTS